MNEHRYLPMTDQDRASMLATIGVESIEDLFSDIPETIRYRERLNVGEKLSEPDLLRYMRKLAAKNADTDRFASFLGAGMYDHHLPVVINHMLLRGEFFTAYTPYQAELSQGELQAIFEFQSYICELTGMQVANASMYDGATALAEAAALAYGATKRTEIIVSHAVHPEAREVLRTTAKGLGLTVVEIPVQADGQTSLHALEQRINQNTAAVLVQSPNFYGIIEPLQAFSDAAHAVGALSVVSANPMSLALLEAPGKLGADLCVGDCQPFGIPVSLGGPSCGYFSATEALMRKIPGRIVGQTVDKSGRRGFVLTLQAREQHIRREKATSNICSNQALMALAASIYLSTMGKEGLRDVAKLNINKAHYAASLVQKSSRMSLKYAASFFNEFVVELPESIDIDGLNEVLLKTGIIGGYNLGKTDASLNRHMLIAVTETRTKEEIDGFFARLEELL